MNSKFNKKKKKNLKKQVQLRAMTEQDAEGVFNVEKQISVEPWSATLFRDCVSVGYSCWVYEDKNEIIGFGLLSCAAGEAHILNLGVVPVRQGEGLGKRMMRHLLKVTRDLDANILYLEVRESNEIAKRMYKNLSFMEVGIREAYYPTEDGGKEDAIVLALTMT